MLVSYRWLQTYFDRELPAPDTLAELLAAHTCEVESLKDEQGDHVLDIKVLPDRAHYLLSHRGVAREVSAICEMPLRIARDVAPPSDATLRPQDVRIEDAALSRRYVARRVENVTIRPSPGWLVDRLRAIGQKSINIIVDAANFVMFDMGQPLHAFDAAQVRGALVVRLAADGERITLLTGEEISLTEEDIIIADDEGPLGIAGVKGGKRAGITDETREIILEAAHFDPVRVRRTSSRLGIHTDASKRFENEITPARAEEGMAAISTLLHGVCQGATFAEMRDVYPRPAKPWRIAYAREEISAILGEDIVDQEIEGILRKIGVNDGVPPLDRLDLTSAEDIADEVGRLRGYGTCPSAMPPDLPGRLPPDKEFFYAEKIKTALVERGYSEVLLYSLVRSGAWHIEQSRAGDRSSLRECLTPSLISSLKMNALNADLLGLGGVKLFEVGRVFPSGGEVTNLALASTGGEDAVRLDLEALGLPAEACELNLSAIIAEMSEPSDLATLTFEPLPRGVRYKPFSPYPYIARDVSMFVSDSSESEQIVSIIRESAGPLLLHVRLFDVYTSDKKTSLAFRLVFQSPERTLTDGEVNDAMEDVYQALRSAHPLWEIR